MLLPRDDAHDFHRLYAAVTASLDEFCRDALRNGTIVKAEGDWYRSLVDGFTDEYAKWGKPTNANIQTFLDDFSAAPKLVRLAGHAFLHIGYDLPRAIADHLQPSTPPLPALPPRSRLRQLFLWPGPMFRQVFREHIKCGAFGPLARLFGQLEPMEVLAYWVVALRSIAWIHAESLADYPKAKRSVAEANLARALNATAAGVGHFHWRIARLDNSKLLQVAPVGLLALTEWPLGPWFLAGAVLGLAVAAYLARSRSIALAIDTMAQYFAIEATRAIQAGEHEYQPLPYESNSSHRRTKTD